MRLTLWYVAALSAVLVLYSGSSLLFLRVSLWRELDRNLGEEYERVEDLLTAAPDGTIGMGGHDEGERERVVEVWSTDQRLLYRSEGLRGQAMDGPPPRTLIEPSFASVRLQDGTPLRVLVRPHEVMGRRVLVRVALSEEPLRAEWHLLVLGLVLGLPVALAIAGLGGHWLARRALRPLDRMARHAERLTADNLDERLPVENPDDELGHLARVFNVSLGKIEESFAQLRRFTADVSHELRTPLTAIRSVGEVGLGDHATEQEYREIIGSILEEADRLTVLVDTLLALSRADAGEVSLHREDVDLMALARDVVSHLGVLAEEKGQVLVVEGSEPVLVDADRLVLRQALVNVVDNAVKYSPPGRRVRVVVGGDAATGQVDIIDEGPGIPAAHHERIFERFYRVDKARSREQGGAGLGLSLARWAVVAHGGRIDVESEEGRGSTFRVSLPRGKPDSPGHAE
jgi:heavy metal sensor kinase